MAAAVYDTQVVIQSEGTLSFHWPLLSLLFAFVLFVWFVVCVLFACFVLFLFSLWPGRENGLRTGPKASFAIVNYDNSACLFTNSLNYKNQLVGRPGESLKGVGRKKTPLTPIRSKKT